MNKNGHVVKQKFGRWHADESNLGTSEFFLSFFYEGICIQEQSTALDAQ